MPESEASPSGGVSREAMQGAPWLVISKGVLFFVYFGISILMVRTLGPSDYGVYSLYRNLVEYGLVFAAFGLNASLLRFIPELTVHRNRAGMIRLLVRAGVMQGLFCLLLGTAFILARPLLDQWFNADFGSLLPLCALLLFALAGKDFVNDALTALFRSRDVALFSMLQGLGWLALVGVAVWVSPRVGSMLGAQILATLLASSMGACVLVRYVRSLKWRSPPAGVGKKRVLRLAVATWGNQLARALMLKYTEVFFLGAFFGTAAAGIYDLGYTVPFLVITFIPMAVQTLMAASVYEAYSRNPDCLPDLIGAIYRFLILLAIPLAAFGVFFAPRGIELIYGEEMKAAGPVAAAFCVLHIFPLISVPLSMAIQAREKLHNMLPLMLAQVVLNILLDLLLIPRFGIPGAVAAVFLTFALTIPFRLWMVRRLVGGIFFPFPFLLRVLFPCLALSGLLWAWNPAPGLAVLLILSGLYLAAVGCGVRLGWLVPESDKAPFRQLISGKLRSVFLILLGPELQPKDAL